MDNRARAGAEAEAGAEAGAGAAILTSWSWSRAKMERLHNTVREGSLYDSYLPKSWIRPCLVYYCIVPG